jgi:L-lactate utilization protein LutB
MDKNTNWGHITHFNTIKEKMEKNNFEVVIMNSKDEVQEYIKNIIKEESTVGVGGSMTLFETGIIDLLRKLNINFLDRYEPNLTAEELTMVHHNAFNADYYLASTNAITLNGELYNVDGTGNRVAALSYGPKKVILIVGRNKIVNDIKAADDRVRNFAAPVNAKRLNRKTPCTITGKCSDCSSPDRICNFRVITNRVPSKNRITILLVNEELGY